MISSLIWSQVITTSGVSKSFFSQGNRASTLYEQLPVNIGTAYTSQEFPDVPTYSNEGADDFIIPAGQTWTIETVTGFGGGWNGFTTGSDLVNIKFYNDDGGKPAATPFQSYLSYDCTTELAYPAANLIAGLPVPLTLPAGHYWVSVAMVGEFSVYGQWGLHLASSISNIEGYWINPGNGFNVGTTWNPASVLTIVPSDWAFRLEGTAENVGPAQTPVSNWALIIGIGLILMIAVIRFRRIL